MAQDNDTLYHEPYRPQFHFSPPSGWMNDPNGMVYYEGEYHFFYQFSPEVSRGPIHWGHAVSPDLVHWENLPPALLPDEIGPIWSGCAVVDAANTSGLVPGGGLVAMFTYENQSQGIAYSNDRGRTWTKYAGNPVIGALAKDFRDPKVIWHEATQQWAMVLAAGQEIQFFTSPNLLDWTYASSFAGGHLSGVWEVPDLFPLEIDGETKWILLVSVTTAAPAGGNGIQYFVGGFDGRTFTNDNPTTILWLDYGADNYAGTTWDSAPDGRRIYIGWLGNWEYAFALPTTVWRGAATLPRDLKLVGTGEGIRLSQSVPASFESLRTPVGRWDDLTVAGVYPLDLRGRRFEISAEFEPGTAERFGFVLHRAQESGTRVTYDVAQSQVSISRTNPGGLAGFNPAFGAPVLLDNGRLRLHIYLDESSVEVLAQDGLVSITGQTFVDPSAGGLALFAENGDAKAVHLEVYALASVWAEART